MIRLRLIAQPLAACLFISTVTGPAHAGPSKAQLDKYAAHLKSIPAEHQHLLSSGLQRILSLDAALNTSHPKFSDTGGTVSPSKFAAAARLSNLSSMEPTEDGTVRVSDPRLDFKHSAMGGFSQSETASAWCGNTVVAGYNDSGAFARTAGVNYNAAWSFSSVSYSHDGGRTFTEAGYMNPGTNPVNFIAGDPVIACTSPSKFYYSSIFASGKDAAGNIFNGVAINTSNNGGQTWSAPGAAVAKDFNHGIDKPWLAADPTNPDRLYVTYTDFDFSGFSDPAAGCPNDIRYAIEMVVSSDAGVTWTHPLTIHQECYFSGGANGVQGSNVAVDRNGTVYIGYEFFSGSAPTNEIRVARSVDHGVSIIADVKVSDVRPNGNSGLLQGGFRNNEFPQVAVDRSENSSNGSVYVAFSDGTHVVQDLPIIFGTYAYPDVKVAHSSDGGKTFSKAVAVSPTPMEFQGRGRDQFFPGMSVDKDGIVGVCYYDRREHSNNDVIDRYCSTSQNYGATWDEQRVSQANWTPTHAADGLINATYIGDYDAVSSDFLLQRSGFLSTFEVQTDGNPDVVAARIH